MGSFVLNQFIIAYMYRLEEKEIYEYCVIIPRKILCGKCLTLSAHLLCFHQNGSSVSLNQLISSLFLASQNSFSVLSEVKSEVCLLENKQANKQILSACG